MLTFCNSSPREACHRDIVNLQVEMIKQFHVQLVRINSMTGNAFSFHFSNTKACQLLKTENQIFSLQTRKGGLDVKEEETVNWNLLNCFMLDK